MLLYSGHSDSVFAVAWSPDSTRCASAGRDRTVQVWDAATGACQLVYREHNSYLLSLSWSPDGQYIASGDTVGVVRVWQASTGNTLFV